MSRPIHYLSRSENPAQRVYGALTDREYLQTRLDRVGGKSAALLELDADADAGRYTLRMGVGQDDLPAVVRRVLPNDLVIERTETWRRTAPGHYDGAVTARVLGGPGSVRGTLRLADLDDGPGSELSLDGSAKVDLPLIGGRLEAVIAEQVVRLIDRETRFTSEWLAR